MRRIQRISLLLALALTALTVHAQAVFRSVMPDGRIVFGNKPEPGAKESKPMNLPAPNISAPTPASSGSGEPAPVSGRNNADVITAQARLEAAQKALEAGREPQPGERTGVQTKSGSPRSQLTDGYLQRIKGLEDAVSTAQEELDNAQRSAR